MKGAREAYEEGGEEALERFIRDSLGEHADEVLEHIGLDDSIRFADLETLLSHFQKHASEFDYQTDDEYLQGARALTTREGVDTFVRPNGDMLFYDRRTRVLVEANRSQII